MSLEIINNQQVSSNDIQRFLSKVKIIGFCWEWQASKTLGYGMFSIKHKVIGAHRFIYEYYFNRMDSNLQIDHLCRNRACVNPFHLELVTQKINLLRGFGISAINARKTHCPQGHEYSEENTWISKKNHRFCKICAKKYKHNDYMKRKYGN